MKVLICVEYCGDISTLTERKIVANIGDSLKYHGIDVDFIHPSHVSDLSMYDACIWDCGNTPPLYYNRKGYYNTINLLFANGGAQAGLDIDGVIYSRKFAYRGAIIRHNEQKIDYRFIHLFPPAMKLLYEPVKEFGKYILIAGTFHPDRGLRIGLLADIMSKSKMPIKIVMKQCAEKRPDGTFKFLLQDSFHDVNANLYNDMFNLYRDYADKEGVVIEEYSALPSIDFQRLMRYAGIYIHTPDCFPGSVVCYEAMLYGIPMIASNLDRFSFLDSNGNNYFHVNRDLDFSMARKVTEHIDYICTNCDEVKAKSLQWVNDNTKMYSYEYAGKDLIDFIEGIIANKNAVS